MGGPSPNAQDDSENVVDPLQTGNSKLQTPNPTLYHVGALNFEPMG